MNLMSKPRPDKDFVNADALDGPRFLITVDTEEEFDWSKPFSRDQHDTKHVGAIDRFQALCELHGTRPAYLIDYPIANDPQAVELLGDYAKREKASVGVQLHPWVNPPFDEAVNAHNSYACNLPPELEREKLLRLHAKIVQNFGLKPDIYRAGRYGAGEVTPEILHDLGISIDTSVRSHFDYTPQGGPDYSNAPANPYWIKRDRLLELPITTLFSGSLRNMGRAMFRDMFASDTSRSIMARTGLLERIALTPEGIPLKKAIEGVDRAIEQNVGILNFSFHSPSLEPGNTPYVTNGMELERFYSWWDGIFAHLAKRDVRPISVEQIKATFLG